MWIPRRLIYYGEEISETEQYVGRQNLRTFTL
jgi:hypothetical protein